MLAWPEFRKALRVAGSCPWYRTQYSSWLRMTSSILANSSEAKVHGTPQRVQRIPSATDMGRTPCAAAHDLVRADGRWRTCLAARNAASRGDASGEAAQDRGAARGHHGRRGARGGASCGRADSGADRRVCGPASRTWSWSTHSRIRGSASCSWRCVAATGSSRSANTVVGTARCKCGRRTATALRQDGISRDVTVKGPTA